MNSSHHRFRLILKSELRRGPVVWAAVAALALGSSATVAAAPETPPAPAAEEAEQDAAAKAREVVYDRVTVVGAPEAAGRVPGSAHVITGEELERYQHTDVHRILRQVPGVNVQEEDGFGLRPNIGLRGTGVERSQKVTLLEDGVLIAPAPYSAPAAYYFPTAGRMDSIEVRKGSAAIRQGPQTNGGAINLISSAIPGDLGGRLKLAGGDHGTTELHGRVGASRERFGFLLETFRQETSGFKRLDGGGPTGFELEDYLAKLRFNAAPGARVYQELEIKLGKTVQDGDETYLGLTREDFDRDPLRRYRGSARDRIDTDHEQVVLRYFVRPSARFDLTTTLYRNDYFRNWFKNESTLGVSNGRILADPGSHATELAILRGELDSPDDAMTLRNNRRDYYSRGVQSTVGWRAGDDHRFELGVRVHEDQEDRFQEDDLYAMRGGELVLTRAGAPGSQANRIGEARALAVFVEDQISLGRLTLTPGLRWETVDTRRLDFGKDDPARTGVDLATRENRFDALLPGLGADYRLDGGWRVFGSVHRGFSPPGPSSREPVEPEESLNLEAGVRYRDGATRFEAVAFRNDYSNLLGADTFSSGGTGTGDQYNGGEVDVHGLELGYATVLRRGERLSWPLRATYTYTAAEFRSSFTTGFADWAPEVRIGDALPYLPEHQAFAEIGVEASAWGVRLGASFVDEMRTSAGAGAIPEAERIEDRLVVDLGGDWTLRDRYRFYLQVRNLGDETYVAARRPYGLRPGLPRTTLVGVAIDF